MLHPVIKLLSLLLLHLHHIILTKGPQVTSSRYCYSSGPAHSHQTSSQMSISNYTTLFLFQNKDEKGKKFYIFIADFGWGNKYQNMLKMIIIIIIGTLSQIVSLQETNYVRFSHFYLFYLLCWFISAYYKTPPECRKRIMSSFEIIPVLFFTSNIKVRNFDVGGWKRAIIIMILKA